MAIQYVFGVEREINLVAQRGVRVEQLYLLSEANVSQYFSGSKLSPLLRAMVG